MAGSLLICIVNSLGGIALPRNLRHSMRFTNSGSCRSIDQASAQSGFDRQFA